MAYDEGLAQRVRSGSPDVRVAVEAVEAEAQQVPVRFQREMRTPALEPWRRDE